MRIDAKGTTATYSHTHALPAGGGVVHMESGGYRPPSPERGFDSENEFDSGNGLTFGGEYGEESALGRRVCVRVRPRGQLSGEARRGVCRRARVSTGVSMIADRGRQHSNVTINIEVTQEI